MQRLKRKRKDLNCKVELGKTYEVSNYFMPKGANGANHKLKEKYTGRCVYKSDDIAVFDTGKYKVTEIINCYGVDWKVVEV